jgi:hypothetical protein
LTKYGVYDRSIPLTASKTAPCTMAPMRTEFCGDWAGPVSALVSALVIT